MDLILQAVQPFVLRLLITAAAALGLAKLRSSLNSRIQLTANDNETGHNSKGLPLTSEQFQWFKR
jgi:hypothetical protein